MLCDSPVCGISKEYSRYHKRYQFATMIITLGGVKGGEGKSSLATNLAICRCQDGHDVLLIDADKQRSASDFTLVRKETLGSAATGYTAIQLRGTAVRDETQRLADKYTDIIIDVGGRDTIEQRAAIAISHVYAVPVVPSSYDLWALEQAAELIDEGRSFNPHLHALCFLSRTPARGSEINEAIELIKEIPQLELINSVIVERKVWRTSTSKGLSVLEIKPSDKKAIAELMALYEALFNPDIEPKKQTKRKAK